MKLRLTLVAVIATLALMGCDPAEPVAGGEPAPPAAHLAFADEFNGSALDAGAWTTCYPWQPPVDCTNVGTGEEEWYTPAQVTVGSGAAHLTAKRADTAGRTRDWSPKVYPYASGMITTGGHFSFTYGYVEIRAKVPRGGALWTTLWLLPADFSWPPEVDILEAKGREPDRALTTYHPPGGGEPATWTDVANSGDWHTYAVDWRPGSLTWIIDGHQVFHQDQSPAVPMYVLANLAVGGSFGGAIGSDTPSTASLDLDYVRVQTY